jgi:hypothetical protein
VIRVENKMLDGTKLMVDPETSREAASPQYLRGLLTSGPLQNFSILAFHMAPHLKERGHPGYRVDDAP